MTCTAMIRMLNRRLNALCPANPQNTLVIDIYVMIAFQIVTNAAVSLVGRFLVNLLNDLCDLFIFSGTIADAPGCPPVIGCSGNMEDPACSLNRVSKFCVAVMNCYIQMLLLYLR